MPQQSLSSGPSVHTNCLTAPHWPPSTADPTNCTTVRAYGTVEFLRKAICAYSGGKASALLTYNIATREHAQDIVDRLRDF